MNEKEKAEHNEKYRAKEPQAPEAKLPQVEKTTLLPQETPTFELSLVSNKDAKERMDICRACPTLKLKSVCSACGCFMPAKTRIKNSSCPELKW